MVKRAIASIVLVVGSSVPTWGAVTDRLYGIDVSLWQGTINWQSVGNATFHGGKSVDFAFIRATRGASPSGTAGNYTDPNFVTNITGALANGIIPGMYHYARPDLNSAVSEAQYFLGVAGSYMTYGNLRPVLDLEAGRWKQVQDPAFPNDPTKTITVQIMSRTAYTDWAIAFCNEIVRVKGESARPILYMNTSYATDAVDNRLRDYSLWIGRPAGDLTQLNSWDMTTQNPTITGYSGNPYGVWKTTLDPHPWSVWQYYIPEITGASNALKIAGISANVDLNVINNAQGGLAALLIPEPSVGVMLLVPGMMLGRRRKV